jgi:hypothetical protein
VVKDALGYSFVSSMVWGFRVVCWERRSFLLRMRNQSLIFMGAAKWRLLRGVEEAAC